MLKPHFFITAIAAVALSVAACSAPTERGEGPVPVTGDESGVEASELPGDIGEDEERVVPGQQPTPGDDTLSDDRTSSQGGDPSRRAAEVGDSTAPTSPSDGDGGHAEPTQGPRDPSDPEWSALLAACHTRLEVALNDALKAVAAELKVRPDSSDGGSISRPVQTLLERLDSAAVRCQSTLGDASGTVDGASPVGVGVPALRREIARAQAAAEEGRTVQVRRTLLAAWSEWQDSRSALLRGAPRS